jgi:hypothetical protein
VAPVKFTIDICHAERLAIEDVYPGVTIQWCLFHVGRAWMQKIRSVVAVGFTAKNKAIHTMMMQGLRLLFRETIVDNFQLLLQLFLAKYQYFTDFTTYFNNHYVKNEWYKNWAAAYQPQYETQMETNNFVKFWNNQLKTVYLRRKATNRRVDRLIYILVNDVEPDYTINVNRLSLRIGRMGFRAREEAKRQAAADLIPITNIDDYVETIKEGEIIFMSFNINSFSDDDVHYIVGVENNALIRNCSNSVTLSNKN